METNPQSTRSTTNLGWEYYRNYYFHHETQPLTLLRLLNQVSGRSPSEAEKKEMRDLFAKGNERLIKAVPVFPESVSYTSTLEGSQTFQLKTTYPGLFSGGGITHETGGEGEFKLGFQFDYTTGLPVLPGSSVKGKLRAVFPNRLRQKAKSLSDQEWRNKNRLLKLANQWETYIDYLLCTVTGKPFDESHPTFSPEFIFLLEWALFEGAKLVDQLPVLPDGQPDFSRIETRPLPTYESAIFYDAFPVESKHTDNKILGIDFITPHKHSNRVKKHLDALVNPTPIQFLKVLPNVVWAFSFRLSPFTQGNITIAADQIGQLFKLILLELGIGAKTRVGYGQFVETN